MVSCNRGLRMHFKKFPSHKQATPLLQHSLSAAVDKNRLFTAPNENVPPYTAHIGVVSASTSHISPPNTHTAHCTHTLVARSQTTFTRRERVWNDAYKWLVQNSPRTGRSIIAFPPGESGLPTRDYTTLTQHTSLAMMVHSAVRSAAASA